MTLFRGRPVEISYANGLRDAVGNEAHAATFIRERRILLDAGLRRKAAERERIVLHELFHFVWVRLGNGRRRGWEELLRREWEARARGEAGWSAEWRKRELGAQDVAARTRRWREYCCESFCDTAAVVYGATSRECTLGRLRMAARRTWFAEWMGAGPFGV